MADAPIQSPHYLLVVGKKENSILSCFLFMVKENPEMFAHALSHFDVSNEEFVSFVKDSADKEHALGWCEDPDCKDKRTPV